VAIELPRADKISAFSTNSELLTPLSVAADEEIASVGIRSATPVSSNDCLICFSAINVEGNLSFEVGT
jgi:hypothetical protein